MSFLQTTDDLRLDALFRAGEPQNESSSFWVKSLDYLNRIQTTLMIGGAVAAGRDLATSAGIYAHLVDLPITDWWWARKRGVFNTDTALQLTADLSGTTITFSSAVTTNLTGWFVTVPGRSTVPRILAHTPGSATATMDAGWPEETTLTGANCFVYRLEYDLPSDFLRFASPPLAHAFFGSILDVGSLEGRNLDFPVSSNRQGPPSRAYMTKPQTVTLNGYDLRQYRLEFEYVAMPPKLIAGGQPPLPQHWKPVLAVGASMLMTFDKNDTRAANLASEYREWVSRMVQEHRKMMSSGSTTFGTFRCRQPSYSVRSPQSFGELYLV